MKARFLAVSLTVFVLLFTARCSSDAPVPDTPEARFAQLGERVYKSYCITCHQPKGQGIPGSFPPLQRTDWVEGDKGRLIRLVLHGVQGEMVVQDVRYDGIMPTHGFLSDDQIAAVLTYVRSNFGNTAEGITPEEVATVRRTSERRGVWQADELWEQTGILTD